ncbi:hypothetical protein [Streptomyces hydrogenans]|uniref:Uncharacterized protein n=1 Tax=Streptomyces hydrogenans TaxID=1873719 RepID=A0ABQ3PJN2_9ACTN|nr:hypothetical protein [Streptomyces hydrogenans]GHG09891.1 hypothetical protein GCM10018784_23170 [Streptomyces hydrogenans]GHI25231.1 hypothetical protein Shyd_66020 [Streptomyces hydrogenans]
MTTMIDRWHDAYHAEAPDYVNCPYCQDELELTAPALPLPTVTVDAEVEWGEWQEATFDPDTPPIDRLEDLEV